MVSLRLTDALAAIGLFTSATASRRARARSDQVFDVMTFSAIGILVILNVMRRFPDLGALIVEYNQF
jgi:hypothetical protein